MTTTALGYSVVRRRILSNSVTYSKITRRRQPLAAWGIIFAQDLRYYTFVKVHQNFGIIQNFMTDFLN